MIYARPRLGAQDLRGPSRPYEHSAANPSALVAALYKSAHKLTDYTAIEEWKDAYAARVWMARRVRIRTEPDGTFLSDLVDAGVLHVWED
jgi:hypothetical protein